MNDDPGEELGQMDHDELLAEVIKLRAELDSQAKRYNEILDRHQKEFLGLNQENARLREAINECLKSGNCIHGEYGPCHLPEDTA